MIYPHILRNPPYFWLSAPNDEVAEYHQAMTRSLLIPPDPWGSNGIWLYIYPGLIWEDNLLPIIKCPIVMWLDLLVPFYNIAYGEKVFFLLNFRTEFYWLQSSKNSHTWSFISIFDIICVNLGSSHEITSENLALNQAIFLFWQHYNSASRGRLDIMYVNIFNFRNCKNR